MLHILVFGLLELHGDEFERPFNITTSVFPVAHGRVEGK